MKLRYKILIGVTIFIAIILITAFLVLTFVPGFGKVPSSQMQKEYEKRADNFYDGTFHNLTDTAVLNSSVEKTDTTGVEIKPEGEIPVKIIEEFPDINAEEFTITWFGHSTAMLQMNGLNIFVDPVLSEITSPVSIIGAKRFSDVPMTMENVPEIDVLVLSHDHYDHLDYFTIKAIDDKVKQYVVPLGVESHLLRWGVDEAKIHTMAWWDEIEISNLKISSVPARHYSGRLPWKSDTTLWCGYVIASDKYQVYYTGDTGYDTFFGDIYEKYGEMDLVLTECGQYDPQWPTIHMFPKEVAKAMEEVHAKYVLPMHWGTFALSNHAWNASITDLTKESQNKNYMLITPQIGEIVNYKDIENYQEKWWESIK